MWDETVRPKDLGDITASPSNRRRERLMIYNELSSFEVSRSRKPLRPVFAAPSYFSAETDHIIIITIIYRQSLNPHSFTETAAQLCPQLTFLP